MKIDFAAMSPVATSERFELLRGRRAGTGAPILVKRCRRAGVSEDLVALRRDFAIASGLSGSATLQPRLIECPPSAVIVMDDGGGTLLTEALRQGPLPIDALLAAGAQLAAALAELHGRGIVHRAIRPAAILFNASTNGAWLVDFGDVGCGAPPPTAGTVAAVRSERLVYLSPEQTGRIDCAVDARSDLYALGIVLYEMLVGSPPFQSDDALEQIHWHLAGTARAPSQVRADVPALLDDLVLKLLAKNPDDRYQFARTLEQDLADCSRAWAAGSTIPRFALARGDLGGRLRISSRLYGREREVHALLEAFEHACHGSAAGRMVLVEGYSGIGKTALIQQLYRPIVRQKGYFVSGKFDQVARGVPFGALIQAFRALVRQLLTEGEAQLAAWRQALSESLAGNGGVLTAVIPELEFILPGQQEPIELGSFESQNRFQLVLQNFLSVLASTRHPLILFLDDLQWADPATLGLLVPLLTSPDIHGMMLMGAYRDNELDASPRLAHTLADLTAKGIRLTRISLGPLLPGELTEFVADTLHGGTKEVAPLARLVYEKTGGNPFFVIQFLRLLEREQRLGFDAERMRWTYDIEQIAELPLTNNVVDLMTRRINGLPPNTRYALTLAACIGSRFDGRTLAVVIEQNLGATEADLRPALAEGLIVRAVRGFGEAMEHFGGEFDGYEFLHDRVQQSAYALIPAERRKMVHLTVGRLLRQRMGGAREGFGVFDIVNHLNLGRELVHDANERRDLAELNLAAGRRAKSSTAHDTALELFRAGVELLEDSDASDADRLHFELHLEAAESEYFCGDSDASLHRLEKLASIVRSPIEAARIARLRSVQYENMARYVDALASARAGLALLGVSFPDEAADKETALEHEVAQIESLRDGRAIGSLLDLPTMVDPRVRMVMVILTDIWSATFILGDATMARLISATMVRLSLIHGNTEESAYGYVTHAITVGAIRGESNAAYEFGRLALDVNQRFGDVRLRAKVYQQFHAHVNFWCQPFLSCLPYAREACHAGLQSGDFLYAGYGAGTEPWAAIAAVQDLARFVVDYTPTVALVEKLRNKGFADSVRLLLNWSRALQGQTVEPLSLTDADFDEARYVRDYRDNTFFAGIHAVARLHLCALLGSPEQALDAAQVARTLVAHLPGTIWPLICDFWDAMALAANLDGAGAPQRGDGLARLKRTQTAFADRAEHCEENFRSQALLLAAEIARVEGRDRDAIELCESAIEFAAGKPLIAFEALAHEMAGRHHLRLGRPRLALLHLIRARDVYRAWGAHAKVDALARQYPGAPWPVAAPRPEMLLRRSGDVTHAPALPARVAPVDGLDLFSVLKATQAIAGEFDLSRLQVRLLQIAIESAGAERGALVLEGNDGPIVVRGAALGGDDAAPAVSTALEHSDDVPRGIVNYVRRTAEDVVLARAETDEQHGADPYVLQHRPRSVLCLPVQTQGRKLGVVYLEHRGVAAAFTVERVRTLRILATQAAISLDCARLFDGLTQEIAERRRAMDELGAALAEVERFRDTLQVENTHLRRDLIANVSHDLRTPLASMRGYLEILSTHGDSLAKAQRDQYLAIALRQSESMACLIDELFELAKLDFKGVKIEREPFAFDDLAEDVVQKFRLLAAERRVELRVDTVQRPPFAYGDVALMERVFDNLIANSIRYTPAGGTVSVRIHAQAGRVFAEIADTGCGIAAADLPFVFDRFYRSSKTPSRRSDRSAGAGLGLAITKRILELHGATIAVDSEESAGTRFTFDLPQYSEPQGGVIR